MKLPNHVVGTVKLGWHEVWHVVKQKQWWLSIEGRVCSWIHCIGSRLSYHVRFLEREREREREFKDCIGLDKMSFSLWIFFFFFFLIYDRNYNLNSHTRIFEDSGNWTHTLIEEWDFLERGLLVGRIFKWQSIQSYGLH